MNSVTLIAATEPVTATNTLALLFTLSSCIIEEIINNNNQTVGAFFYGEASFSLFSSTWPLSSASFVIFFFKLPIEKVVSVFYHSTLIPSIFYLIFLREVFLVYTI